MLASLDLRQFIIWFGGDIILSRLWLWFIGMKIIKITFVWARGFVSFLFLFLLLFFCLCLDGGLCI